MQPISAAAALGPLKMTTSTVCAVCTLRAPLTNARGTTIVRMDNVVCVVHALRVLVVAIRVMVAEVEAPSVNPAAPMANVPLDTNVCKARTARFFARVVAMVDALRGGRALKPI